MSCRVLRSVLVTFASAVTLACFFAPISRAQAQQKSRQLSASEEVGKIPALWARTLQSKQIDQLAALYTPDAVFLKPTGERITGRPAVRDLCKKIMDTFSNDFTFHSLASDVSGNIAYDSGEYKDSLVKISDQTKAEVQGNYLMIFKRQPDGSWLIAQQMWTLVTPPTE